MKAYRNVLRPLILLAGIGVTVPALAQQCEIWESVRDAMDCSVPDNFDELTNPYTKMFHSACVGHDTCFMTIGKTKKQCDDTFYNDMYNLCGQQPIAKPLAMRRCFVAASAFYAHVRANDRKSWNANQAQAKRSYCAPCNKSWDGHHLRSEGGRPATGSETARFWENMPTTAINAAIGWKNDKYRYFFVGTNYYRYDMDTDRVSNGFPKDNALWGLNGQWKRVDAAVYWPNRGKQGKVYFFRGNQYRRFDVKDNEMDGGYPKSISEHWKGVPNNIDAAFYAPKPISRENKKRREKVYFFKDDKYWRYDLKRDKVDKGYPKLTADLWHGLWIRDLDAAVAKQTGRYPTRVYFFKDSKYKRFLTKWDCATN